MHIWTICRKEITENILTFRNVITTVLCLVLFPTSIFLSYNDYKTRLANYNLRDTEGQHYFGHRPMLAKKPTPLSIFARGLDPDMGRLTIIWQGSIRGGPGGEIVEPGEENDLLSLFRVPDFSYLVQTVLSLLALFFAFDAICGERVRGTLRLLLANSVSRSEVLLGKWFGGLASFLLSVLPGFALMLFVVTLLPMLSLDGEAWLRVGAIIGVSLIYLSSFFLLGLFLSTRVHRPETALILILLAWLIWVIGVPNFSSLIANRIYSYSLSNTVTQKQNAEADSEKELYEQLWKINFQAERMVQNQSRLEQHLARVSPLGSYATATPTLAGTGLEDVHRYKGYILRWDRQRRDLEDNPFHPRWDQARREQEGLYFTPTRMSLDESLATIRVDVALLILFNLIFFMGAYLSFLRYSVQ